MTTRERAELSAKVNRCLIHKIRQMKLILTGFSSFSNITKNPTEEIIEILQNEDYKLDSIDIEMEVLQVSIKCCDSFIQKHKNSGNNDVILIHLGVDGSGTHYNLEKCAYNNKDFRIPDVDGNQPTAELISLDQSLDQPLQTTLSIDTMISVLSLQGYSVKESTDPGRYLCNYIYYNSLYHIHNNSLALFIHVPPKEVFSIDNQVSFIKHVISIIVNDQLLVG